MPTRPHRALIAAGEPGLDVYALGVLKAVVMHEIDHVVRNSTDAERNGEAGDCENQINRMRRECGLPERANYYFSFLPATINSDFRTKFVRLPFDRNKPGTNKKTRYWLVWDASLVGGLEEQRRLIARM